VGRFQSNHDHRPTSDGETRRSKTRGGGTDHEPRPKINERASDAAVLNPFANFRLGLTESPTSERRAGRLNNAPSTKTDGQMKTGQKRGESCRIGFHPRSRRTITEVGRDDQCDVERTLRSGIASVVNGLSFWLKHNEAGADRAAAMYLPNHISIASGHGQ